MNPHSLHKKIEPACSNCDLQMLLLHTVLVDPRLIIVSPPKNLDYILAHDYTHLFFEVKMELNRKKGSCPVLDCRSNMALQQCKSSLVRKFPVGQIVLLHLAKRTCACTSYFRVSHTH